MSLTLGLSAKHLGSFMEYDVQVKPADPNTCHEKNSEALRFISINRDQPTRVCKLSLNHLTNRIMPVRVLNRRHNSALRNQMPQGFYGWINHFVLVVLHAFCHNKLSMSTGGNHAILDDTRKSLSTERSSDTAVRQMKNDGFTCLSFIAFDVHSSSRLWSDSTPFKGLKNRSFKLSGISSSFPVIAWMWW